jgi:stress response protein SCP2
LPGQKIKQRAKKLDVELDVNLKQAEQVMVTLTWDEVFGSQYIDCDSIVILCGKNGSLSCREDIVSVENRIHISNSLRYVKDSPSGQGKEDTEQLLMILKDVPEQYEKIVLVISIYQAKLRRQHFGHLRNLIFRLIDIDTKNILINHSVYQSTFRTGATIVGEMYRVSEFWRFRFIEKTLRDGEISRLVKRYTQKKGSNNGRIQ